MHFRGNLFRAVVGAGLAAFLSPTAYAFESGYPAWAMMPGIAIGVSTAGVPGPGVYMFDQAFAYQAKFVGPGAPNVGGKTAPVHLASGAVGFLWVPGWEFLGAKYNAVLVQGATMSDLGAPVNLLKSGVKNTYIVPAELSWKLWDSGFYVKAGLGIHVPDGSTAGLNSLASIGNPWWTFQPEFLVSYLKDGWNLTLLVSQEMNTRSSMTGYRTGNILHTEVAATKTIGNWTFGPLAYYGGQVSDDSSSAFYKGAIPTNRYNIWGAGGLVGYDFGKAALKVWGFQDIAADASGGNPPVAGHDPASITKGFKLFASLSYRIWAPDQPAIAYK